MPEKKSIYQRLVAFQGESPITKKDEENPFYKSKYAPLDAIQEAIQPVLARHELGYMFQPTSEGLKAILFDVDDNTIEFVYPANLSGKPQEIGSNITYAKRYALTAMLGLIVADEDDDGNKANDQKEAKVEKKNTKPWFNFPELTEFKTRIKNQDVKQMTAYVNDINSQYAINNAMKTQIKEAVAKREAELQQSQNLPNTDNIVNEYV